MVAYHLWPTQTSIGGPIIIGRRFFGSRLYGDDSWDLVESPPGSGIFRIVRYGGVSAGWTAPDFYTLTHAEAAELANTHLDPAFEPPSSLSLSERLEQRDVDYAPIGDPFDMYVIEANIVARRIRRLLDIAGYSP